MKRLRIDHSDDDLDGIADVDKLATWARRFIGVIGGILLAIFTWLQLREIPLADVAQNTTPEILIKTALVIYYACWIGGTTFDVKIQQKVYVLDPNRGRVTLDTFIIIFGFFVVAVALLWASSNERIFSAVLALFVIFNIVGWRHIVSRVRPAAKASRAKFKERNNFFRLEQLNFIEEYMSGKWQTHRFIAMLVIISIANIISLFDSVRQQIGLVVNAFVPNLLPAVTARLLPAICIFVFVIIAEGWIWTKRVNVRAGLLVIDELRAKYVLKPRE